MKPKTKFNLGRALVLGGILFIVAMVTIAFGTNLITGFGVGVSILVHSWWIAAGLVGTGTGLMRKAKQDALQAKQASLARVEQAGAALFTVKDGKVTRVNKEDLE